MQMPNIITLVLGVLIVEILMLLVEFVFLEQLLQKRRKSKIPEKIQENHVTHILKCELEQSFA